MWKKKLTAIRGASCITEDTPEAVQKAVSELFTVLYEKNAINEKDIVSIQFTLTPDIQSMNPAAALRKAGFAGTCPLFCSQEPVITGMLPKTVRVLITLYTGKPAVPVYINGAERLRPDLCR
ncbi:MAG: chorismate mutase [Treponema sp.]|nr:chorismate mutase [Candidatus Treponema caballi]